MSSHESDEMKAWQKYSLFLGDEGELRDKDGSKLLDKDGQWIQERSVDNEGGLLDSKGRPIYYNDGTVITYYIPDSGEAYWEDVKRKHSI